MTEVVTILSQLKALGWKDQQIADRLNTRRDTIVKLRTGSGKGITGAKFLPTLRTLLSEVGQPSLPAKEKISRSTQLQPVLQPSYLQSYDQLPVPSTRLPQVTIVEEYPDSGNDEEVRPEIRRAIESSKRLSALRHKPQRANLPPAPRALPTPQLKPARSLYPRRQLVRTPALQQRPTCEMCGSWAPGEPVHYRRDLNLSPARLCSHHASYAKQQGLLE